MSEAFGDVERSGPQPLSKVQCLTVVFLRGLEVAPSARGLSKTGEAEGDLQRLRSALLSDGEGFHMVALSRFKVAPFLCELAQIVKALATTSEPGASRFLIARIRR